jgi:hypothetical protein
VHLGNRDQMGAAEPAPIPFDPTLGPTRRMHSVRPVRNIGCG